MSWEWADRGCFTEWKTERLIHTHLWQKQCIYMDKYQPCIAIQVISLSRFPTMVSLLVWQCLTVVYYGRVTVWSSVPGESPQNTSSQRWHLGFSKLPTKTLYTLVNDELACFTQQWGHEQIAESNVSLIVANEWSRISCLLLFLLFFTLSQAARHTWWPI